MYLLGTEGFYIMWYLTKKDCTEKNRRYMCNSERLRPSIKIKEKRLVNVKKVIGYIWVEVVNICVSRAKNDTLMHTQQ